MASNSTPEVLQEDLTLPPQIPTAIDMLQRLHEIDTEQFDVKAVTDQLKGKQAWFFVLTMPATAILLVVFTLLGTYFTGYLIASFIATAGFLFVIGKMIDQHEQNFRLQARREVMNRIKLAESEAGLIPHFRDFLPKKYRHLWQSLRKHNYTYIDQYISAINLLQKKLDPEKFIRVWQLKHPETTPENIKN